MEERLRKFAALVNAGSFTTAAQELHVSQPALSTAIAKLERELHHELLVRGVRPLQTTAAGQIAYTAARGLALETDRLKSQLQSLAHEQVNLSIGMIDSVASALFASNETFDELEQHANVSIVVNNSRILLQAIGQRELDLAFIATQRQRMPDVLTASFVATEPMVLVCSAARATATQAALQHGKLPQFISYDQSSTSQKLIHGALRSRSIAPSPTFYSTSPEVMLRLVLLEKGAAVLPYLLVRNLIQIGTVVLLGDPEPIVIGRRISSVVRRDKPSTIHATSVAEILRRRLEELYDEVSAYDLGKYDER